MAVFFSCHRSFKAKKTPDNNSTRINKDEEERLKKRKELQQHEYEKNLVLNDVLREALQIAYQNIEKNTFFKKYEIIPDNIPVKVEINLDFHFTETYPHLIIKRWTIGTIYIDIFSKNDNHFKKVLSHEQWLMTYKNDSIRDINGDGLKDFVVNWEGASGCCLKDFSDVYLLRKDKKTFSPYFEFINPTFSPEEKIIRGICYGHPGETEMYKYKWNGEKVDTLEYVSYERYENEKTGRILITTDLPYKNQSKIIKILNYIPDEYETINNYDWFTGDYLKKLNISNN